MYRSHHVSYECTHLYQYAFGRWYNPASHGLLRRPSIHSTSFGRAAAVALLLKVAAVVAGHHLPVEAAAVLALHLKGAEVDVEDEARHHRKEEVEEDVEVLHHHKKEGEDEGVLRHHKEVAEEDVEAPHKTVVEEVVVVQLRLAAAKKCAKPRNRKRFPFGQHRFQALDPSCWSVRLNNLQESLVPTTMTASVVCKRAMRLQ